jgi:hypothetical protein
MPNESPYFGPAKGHGRDDDRSLEEELRMLKDEVSVLRDMLNADGVPAHDIGTTWAVGLTRAQRLLMAALVRAYPRWVQPWDLEASIPSHKGDREHAVNFARVLVSQIRRKRGADVIENQYGVGYRVSADFIASHGSKAA